MQLTEQETVMIEVVRGWSEHRKIKLTASFENGVWECEVTGTPHPLFLQNNPNAAYLPPDYMFVDRGVGTSFVEAFNNLAGNDDEPAEDAAWP